MKRFRDRTDAGRQLARKLDRYANRTDVLVLALPRGGVPVAYEVARHLLAPLDLCVVRKLGMPGQEELAMGAIASGGVRVLNDELLATGWISREAIETETARETQELLRREKAYRGDRPRQEIEGRIVIVVDDGIATGSTMRAALAALRQQHPKKLVVAVPTAAPDTCREFEGIADEMVALITPEPFRAVGLWYENFTQTSDDEVRELLAESEDTRQPHSGRDG
jgi:predicted phosphoribosyltransferase